MADDLDPPPLDVLTTALDHRSLPRRTLALAGLGAAVVVVVVVVVIAAVLTVGRGGSTSPAGAGSTLAGSRWVLDTVGVDGRNIAVASEPQYVLAFPSGTGITLDDSVNFMSGRYARTATGFTTTDVATTLVGYDGADPDRVTTIAAMDAVAFHEGADANTVEAQLHGDELVVTAGRYQLSFIRAGTAAPVPSASGTSSAGTGPSAEEPGSGGTSAGFSGSAVGGAH